MTVKSTLSERLQYLMDVKKITEQRRLSEFVGIDEVQISKWMKGTRGISAKNAKIICEAFGVTNYRWLQTGNGVPFSGAEKTNQIKQELAGGGDNIALKDIGQINGSSFAEKGRKYTALGEGDVDKIRQQLKQLKELQKWQAAQQQRVTVTNYNLQLVVEWMDEQYAGDNQVQTINFLQTMMDLFPSFKAFVDKKTNKT